MAQACGALDMFGGRRKVLLTNAQALVASDKQVMPSLAECSLVLAPYSTGGAGVGTIGVIVPTRLDYPQALSAVAAVSRRLGPALNEV